MKEAYRQILINHIRSLNNVKNMAAKKKEFAAKSNNTARQGRENGLGKSIP